MQQNTELVLTGLSVDDINLLIFGLGKLPLEVAVDLWLRVKAQGEAQLQTTKQSEGN